MGECMISTDVSKIVMKVLRLTSVPGGLHQAGMEEETMEKRQNY